MRDPLKTFRLSDRDNPPNRETALVWSILDNLSRANQVASLDGGAEFRYILKIIKKLVDGYLEEGQ